MYTLTDILIMDAAFMVFAAVASYVSYKNGFTDGLKVRR